jgi:hypothetical protein
LSNGAIAASGDAVRPSWRGWHVLTDVDVFERTVVALSCLFATAAYFDAWTYVNNAQGISVLEPWQDFPLHAGWFLLTAYLTLVMALNIRGGMPLTRSLPSGYGWCMVGCLAFSAFVVIDRWEQAAFGTENSLAALVSPARIGEIVSGGLMVTGPLRAAWRRQDEVAGLPAVMAAAFLLSVITFVTQFAHPYRDPWASNELRIAIQKLAFVSADLGIASLVLQAGIYMAIFLLMMRRFRIRFGSFTLICVFNATLMALLKERWEMILVGAATGIAADVGLRWLQPGPSRATQLRAYAFLVPMVFASMYFLVVAVTDGLWEAADVWSGSILVTGLAGFAVSYLPFTPGGRREPSVPVDAPAAAARPAHFPEITVTTIKEALEALSDKRLLAASPLVRLPYLGRDGADPVADLDDLLRDAARELTRSTEVRDAQAGHLIVEYYVKRSGTHEQIAERLHLSRPTYYHRLQRGCELLAERLDRLTSFATV